MVEIEDDVVSPCELRIISTSVFNTGNPLVLGVEVVDGMARVGTPICVPTKAGIDLGRIISIELNHETVRIAKTGQFIVIKIENNDASYVYGRDFTSEDPLVSRM
jgi:translation initiation factor 5B